MKMMTKYFLLSVIYLGAVKTWSADSKNDAWPLTGGIVISTGPD